MACLRPLYVRSALVLLVGACQADPAEVPGGSTSLVIGSGSGSSTEVTPSTGPGTGIGSGAATGGTGTSTSTGPGVVDSSGSGSGTTTSDGSSSSETTGEPSPIGCADGSRDALLDEVAYPNIAACAGGFGVPGVNLGAPLCDRQGGNDGPLPDGMGCSIDDLCAAGWHVCASRDEVMMAGLGDCGGVSWSTQFFATQQSGDGDNTCGPVGTNDVFGCGDVGYDNISDCAPLNRSTGNLCVELAGPWGCDDAVDEVATLVKPGPSHGGALCCRD